MKTTKKKVNKGRQAAKQDPLPGVKNPMVRAFAMRMMAWRQQKGLTLKDVARDLDLSISIVCEWEHGRRFPSVDHLQLVAEYMDVPGWMLIKDVEKSKSRKP